MTFIKFLYPKLIYLPDLPTLNHGTMVFTTRLQHCYDFQSYLHDTIIWPLWSTLYICFCAESTISPPLYIIPHPPLLPAVYVVKTITSSNDVMLSRHFSNKHFFPLICRLFLEYTRGSIQVIREHIALFEGSCDHNMIQSFFRFRPYVLVAQEKMKL